MGKLCICQICTCGRHRCPHKPYGGGKKEPCTISEYANRYQKHPLTKLENFKPNNEPMHSEGPLEDKTTNRQDYIKHPLGDRPRPHVEDYRKPDGDMDMMTNYTKDYIKKPTERVRAIRKDDAPRVVGKFEGSPTYKNDYRQWQLPNKMDRHQEPVWVPPNDKFEGTPTYKRDYIGYKSLPTKSMKPDDVAFASADPFDDQTGYRKDYIKHPIEARKAKEKPVYNPNKAPLDDMSTFKKDYQGIQGPKMASCKPDSEAFQSSAPLEDATTMRDDYKKWSAQRPHQHVPDAYTKPQGEMDMNTNYTHDYRKHAMQPVKAARPQSRKSVPGKFEDATNYNNDYRKWSMGERQKPTMKPDYVPPDAPFEGLATYKSHYVRHGGLPAASCKPDDKGFASDSPFNDNTMYRTEFIPKKQEPCPAVAVDNSGKYAFDNQDPRGHKWYRPTFESVTPLPQRNSPSRSGLVAA
ncbi:unnamed protein product [Owenia fusiformis]|uniref:Uncharacterized protein n=1 Tax=Owenia fusiformis TaxID=6347 RepID=A0A8J1TVU6_OWEFU|nr:unnamed protein product [Owenia fusiformis]